MSKTQPLQMAPAAAVQKAPVRITPASKPIAPTSSKGGLLEFIDGVPAPVTWTIFGVSALVFILQLWTYLA